MRFPDGESSLAQYLSLCGGQASAGVLAGEGGAAGEDLPRLRPGRHLGRGAPLVKVGIRDTGGHLPLCAVRRAEAGAPPGRRRAAEAQPLVSGALAQVEGGAC